MDDPTVRAVGWTWLAGAPDKEIPMTIRKTAAGGQVTGVEPTPDGGGGQDGVPAVDSSGDARKGRLEFTAAGASAAWTPDDEAGLANER